MSNVISKKIRAGLYSVTAGDRTFTIEERQDMDSGRWRWVLSDDDSFHDSWLGNFATKRDALQEIADYHV